MKKFAVLFFTFLLGVAVLRMFAQSYGAFGVGPIAPTVANCPAGQPGNYAVLCPVGSSSAGYTMYVSYNGGAYQLLVPASTASVTGTLPIVVSGNSVTCPTCVVTGSVVTGFGNPPRKGDVTLTKADITATGIAVTTASTSSIQ